MYLVFGCLNCVTLIFYRFLCNTTCFIFGCLIIFWGVMLYTIQLFHHHLITLITSTILRTVFWITSFIRCVFFFSFLLALCARNTMRRPVDPLALVYYRIEFSMVMKILWEISCSFWVQDSEMLKEDDSL